MSPSAPGAEAPAPELHHHREGAGEPLVLLHGIAHHWQAFAPVVPALARDFDVLAVDLAGFGRSDGLPGGVGGVHDHAAALERWFAAQGLGRPHVAGDSMGGAIALELARRGAVRSATAVSPAGFWGEAGLRWARVLLRALVGMPHALRPAVLRAVGTPVGRVALASAVYARPARLPADEARATFRDAWGARGFEAALAAFADYRVAPGADAEVPVTVAWGTRDVLLPHATQARRAREVLPRARHVALPGLGHIPFSDDPGMVAEVLRAGALRGSAARAV